MLSNAARRPARPDRTPRRTRATAPAHSNPSCTGAFFLVIDSFIRQNPLEEKRDPDNRSTLRHSLGPKGTRIPSSAAVLASTVVCPRGFSTTRINLRWSRDQNRFPSPIHDQDGDQNNRLEPIQIAWQVTITSDNSSIYFDPRHFWRFNDSDDQKGEATGKAISPQPRQN
jgi:hypothetical protein